VCGGLLARQVAWAEAHLSEEESAAIRGRFTFFAVERLPQAAALVETIASGADRLSASYLS
jgi:hypothetical protein